MILRDFKDIHKNKDIYILASGKSVDFIDNGFFENKIIIGVNQAYKKVPCQYLVRKEAALINDILKKNPTTIHFISRGDCGGLAEVSLRATYNALKPITDKKNIVIYDHNNNNSSNIHSLPLNDKLISSHSTITTAIHLGAYMGAKNIILVGHDCGSLNKECNFKGYHTDATYSIAHQGGKNTYIQWLKLIELQTIQLKMLLKKSYGCNVYSLNPFINFNLEGNVYTK